MIFSTYVPNLSAWNSQEPSFFRGRLLKPPPGFYNPSKSPVLIGLRWQDGQKWWKFDFFKIFFFLLKMKLQSFGNISVKFLGKKISIGINKEQLFRGNLIQFHLRNQKWSLCFDVFHFHFSLFTLLISASQYATISNCKRLPIILLISGL